MQRRFFASSIRERRGPAHRVFVLCALTILAGLPWALEPACARAEVVSLQELERRAVVTRQNIQGRAARVAVANSHADAAAAEGRPTLILATDATLSPGGQLVRVSDAASSLNDVLVRGQPAIGAGGNSFMPNGRFTARFVFEGTFFDFGRSRARVAGGRADAAATEAEIAALRDDVVRSVRAAYLTWYGAFEMRRFAESALADAEDRVRRMQSTVGEGARSPFDVESAQLEAARLRLDVSRAESDEDDARLQLGQAVGAALSDSAEPDPAVVSLEPPSDVMPTSRMANALDMRRDASVAATEVYRLRHAPILLGSIQAGVIGQAGVTSAAFPMYQLTIGLNVPLWDPKAGDYLVREAHAQAAELEANANELRSASLVTNLRARARFDHATHQVALANDVLRMSENAAERTEERWRISGGTFDAVLTARERTRRAHQDLVQAQLDRADAALRLMPVE